MIFQQMTYLGKSVIPQFHVISTVLSIFEVILIIEVIFKVKRSILKSSQRKYHFYYERLGTCVIPLFCIFFCHFEHIGKLFILNNNRFSPSLTLFCYIYDVFYVSYRFFLLISNPMSVLAWKVWTFFKIRGQKVMDSMSRLRLKCGLCVETGSPYKPFKC